MIVTTLAPVHTRWASHATNNIAVYDWYPTRPPSIDAIAAPTGPPRFGFRPISTLTRLTVPNAAKASSANAHSSRAIRLLCDGPSEPSSTTAGGGNSMTVFSLRAMGVTPPSRTG